MRLPLRLNAIEQEHLQELYDTTGVARDELPYTPQFEKLCQDFHDRTFKNADREQVFGALLRYVRSSTCPQGQADPVALPEEQISRIRELVRRHAKAGRLLPYSSAFEAALEEFTAQTKQELSHRQFWLAVCQSQSRSRRVRRPAATPPTKPGPQPDEQPGEQRNRRRSEPLTPPPSPTGAST